MENTFSDRVLIDPARAAAQISYLFVAESLHVHEREVFEVLRRADAGDFQPALNPLAFAGLDVRADRSVCPFSEHRLHFIVAPRRNLERLVGRHQQRLTTEPRRVPSLPDLVRGVARDDAPQPRVREAPPVRPCGEPTVLTKECVEILFVPAFVLLRWWQRPRDADKLSTNLGDVPIDGVEERLAKSRNAHPTCPRRRTNRRRRSLKRRALSIPSTRWKQSRAAIRVPRTYQDLLNASRLTLLDVHRDEGGTSTTWEGEAE